MLVSEMENQLSQFVVDENNVGGLFNLHGMREESDVELPNSSANDDIQFGDINPAPAANFPQVEDFDIVIRHDEIQNHANDIGESHSFWEKIADWAVRIPAKYVNGYPSFVHIIVSMICLSIVGR